MKIMEQASQLKVMEAGFIILRADDQPTPRIKYKATGQHNWITLEKYPSKAARDRELAKYLELPTYIAD